MTPIARGGLVAVPLVALFAALATAATDFRDIPYLQARVGQVLESAPNGTEVEWFNEATGNAGVVRVLKTYYETPDRPCRDYQRTTRRPGRPDAVVAGTGCREPSGHWRLKEAEAVEPAPSGGWLPPEPETSAAPGPPQPLLEPPAPKPPVPEAAKRPAPAAEIPAEENPAEENPAEEFPIVMPTPSE